MSNYAPPGESQAWNTCDCGPDTSEIPRQRLPRPLLSSGRTIRAGSTKSFMPTANIGCITSSEPHNGARHSAQRSVGLHNCVAP